jgi:hypothetical protein
MIKQIEKFVWIAIIALGYAVVIYTNIYEKDELPKSQYRTLEEIMADKPQSSNKQYDKNFESAIKATNGN